MSAPIPAVGSPLSYVRRAAVSAVSWAVVVCISSPEFKE
jgi:hypothetical protein